MSFFGATSSFQKNHNEHPKVAQLAKIAESGHSGSHTYYTCLGYLWQCDTNMIVSTSFKSPQIAKPMEPFLKGKAQYG